MADNFIRVSSDRTPSSFLDNARPVPMLEADRIFSTLSLSFGTSSIDAVNFVAELSSLMADTKFHEVDTFWSEFEKKFNGRSPLNSKVATDIGRYEIALGMFYSAANQIDYDPSYETLTGLRNAFLAVVNHITSKVRDHQETKDQRVIDRIVDTTVARIDKIVANYNARVENFELPGPPVE